MHSDCTTNRSQMELRLNLGCGNHKIPGWVNVDISESVSPDEIQNLLTFPWKWEDNSVEEIYCSHLVEHLSPGTEVISFMDEACRVLKVGGKFRIRAPYYTSIRAVMDPTHKLFISEGMFQYFSAEGRKRLGVEHYPIKSDFDVEEMRFHFPPAMSEISEEERKYLLQHAWNTAADIEVVLKKHDPNQQEVDRQENSVLLQ